MEGRAALWTLVGIVIFFKVYAIVLIALFDQSAGMVLLMLAMNLPYILGVLALAAIPALVWFRLIRGRAKRDRLLYEEWHVEEDETKIGPRL